MLGFEVCGCYVWRLAFVCFALVQAGQVSTADAINLNSGTPRILLQMHWVGIHCKGVLDVDATVASLSVSFVCIELIGMVSLSNMVCAGRLNT